jgi:hypothetical protein
MTDVGQIVLLPLLLTRMSLVAPVAQVEVLNLTA